MITFNSDSRFRKTVNGQDAIQITVQLLHLMRFSKLSNYVFCFDSMKRRAAGAAAHESGMGGNFPNSPFPRQPSESPAMPFYEWDVPWAELYIYIPFSGQDWFPKKFKIKICINNMLLFPGAGYCSQPKQNILKGQKELQIDSGTSWW